MIRFHMTSNRLVPLLALLCLQISVLSALRAGDPPAQGGTTTNNTVNFVRQIGGIRVDPTGIMREATAQERHEQLNQLRQAVQAPAGQLTQQADMRMISLRKLQEAIAAAVEQKQPLSEEMLFLAGLQKIEYVFAYPEQQDIVLAGPAEPWVVRDDATVVGKHSGLPTLLLEDLLVALRSSEITREEAITVSIDPTPEGQKRLQALLSRMNGNGFNPQLAEASIKEAFGMQQITLTAIPKDSRIAETLVAADYQMKRLAMNLESSPVSGLPSYMEMIRQGGASKGAQPRWWLTSQYEAVLHSQDRLAWKLSGAGVKAFTEDEYVTPSGQRDGTGKTNKLAQKWADLFTEKYDQLCKVNSAFGNLRNAIDLCVVAAIIESQQLQQLTGCHLEMLCGSKAGSLQTPKRLVPSMLHPQCSFVHGRVGWTISASGGVEINPWMIVSQAAKIDDNIKSTYTQVEVGSKHWWWN